MSASGSPLVCKYCGSENVIKYGTYKGEHWSLTTEP